MRQVTVNLHTVTVRDAHTGKECALETVRTLEEIMADLEADEREATINEVHRAVLEMLG